MDDHISKLEHMGKARLEGSGWGWGWLAGDGCLVAAGPRAPAPCPTPTPPACALQQETVKKLADIRGSASAAGLDVSVPDNTINKGVAAAAGSAHAGGPLAGCGLGAVPGALQGCRARVQGRAGALPLAPLPAAPQPHADARPPCCLPAWLPSPPPAVGEFRKLALLAEADGHLRQKLQQARRRCCGQRCRLCMPWPGAAGSCRGHALPPPPLLASRLLRPLAPPRLTLLPHLLPPLRPRTGAQAQQGEVG